MGKIIGIEIRNYGVLKHIQMGKLHRDSLRKELGSMVAITGACGSGKSTFADVFRFISDAISSNVEEACNAAHRGGYEQLVSYGSNGPIHFRICCKQDKDSDPIAYELTIAKERNGRPYVKEESLQQCGENNEKFLLHLVRGNGFVSIDEDAGRDSLKDPLNGNKEKIELSDIRKLGITILGEFRNYERIGMFLNFVRSWGSFRFSDTEVRKMQFSSIIPYLDRTGSNLNSTVYRMCRENPAGFQRVLKSIQAIMPHITEIAPEKYPNGQIFLAFKKEGLDTPIYSQRVSGGILELLAYYILLYEGSSRQIFFIDDLDRNLYHKYLSMLVEDMMQVVGTGNARQLFVSTHSPFFLNKLKPEQIWMFDVDEDCFSVVKQMFDNVAGDNK